MEASPLDLVTLPKDLDFRKSNESAAMVRGKLSYQRFNSASGSYNSNALCIIRVTANSPGTFWDTKESFIKFTLTNSTGQTITVTNSIHSIFTQLRILASSNVIEEIQDYDRWASVNQDLRNLSQLGNDKVYLEGLCSLTGSVNPTGTVTLPDTEASLTGLVLDLSIGDDTATELYFDANTTVQLYESLDTLNYSVNTISDSGTQDYCLQPYSSFWREGKTAFPIGMLNNGVDIQLRLNSPSIAFSVGGDPGSNVFSISNVYADCKFVELDSPDAEQALMMERQTRGIYYPLSAVLVSQVSQSASATSFAYSVGVPNLRSLRCVLFWYNLTSTQVYGSNSYGRSTNNITSYYVEVGGQRIPAYSIAQSTTNYGEVVFALNRAVGNTGDDSDSLVASHLMATSPIYAVDMELYREDNINSGLDLSGGPSTLFVRGESSSTLATNCYIALVYDSEIVIGASGEAVQVR